MNMKKMKLIRAIIGVTITAALLTGCRSESQQIDGIENYISEVKDITVPEQVQIIGLGEATHGNVELQNLKKGVFQALVEKDICKVFALEGDFGGCQKVNQYIHGGNGTAKEAAAEIGFSLYRTDEMEALIDWMRDYNETVPEEEQVSFYGFDMQRYDNNKEILFQYLTEVDPEKKNILEKDLEQLTDATVYTQTKDINEKAVEIMNEFIREMDNNKETYIADSDQKSYDIAHACAECIMQNATIQSGSVSYNDARDKYMADKIEEIMSMENGQRIMISGHNGHIQKTNQNMMYKSMGVMLKENYGNAYYAIGTDFIKGKVNVMNSAGNEVNISIKSDNILKDQIKNLSGNEFFLDMQKASEDPDISEMLHSSMKMISIGNEFSSWQKLLPSSYHTNYAPIDGFDGIILLKDVTPTVRKAVE